MRVFTIDNKQYVQLQDYIVLKEQNSKLVDQLQKYKERLEYIENLYKHILTLINTTL